MGISMMINSLQATQFVLSKHHLLEEYKADDVVQAAKDVVDLHATSSTTPYLPLFARVRNFDKEHLDKELYVKGYKERERLISREMHFSVYHYGEASPTILMDGKIART